MNLGPHSHVFTQTADVTVASTAAETTLIGTGVGSVTLPANFLVAGTTLYIRACGYYTTTGTPTIDVKIKIGGTTALDTTANNAPSGISSARFWEATAVLTCRTTGAPGTVIGQGTVRYATSHTGESADDFGPATTTTNATTTGTLAIDLTVQWGTSSASNSITCTNLVIWADQPI